MRDLVRIYVLDQIEDRDGYLRRDLSQRMLLYYDQRIATEKRTDTTNGAKMFQAEQLYHRLYLDLAEGFEHFDTEYQAADKQGDVALCDLLLVSARPFVTALPARQRLMATVYGAWLDIQIGHFEQAETTLRPALEQLKSLNHPSVDRVANSLGFVYRQQGRYTEALALYDEALIANQNSDKPERECDRDGAMILNNIGNIYRLQGRVDEAHRYSLRSLALRQLWGDPLDLANSYYVLGLILREFGDNTGALRYFDNAEALFSQPSLGNSGRKGVANVIRQRAYIYGHLNEYGKAIELANESRRILEREVGGKLVDLADAFDILGRLYRDRAVYEESRETVVQVGHEARERDFRLAEEYAERGYALARETGDRFKEAESILSYVRLCSVRKDYEQALNWYKRGVELCEPFAYYLLLSYLEVLWWPYVLCPWGLRQGF